MKIFVDTADMDEIREANAMGVLDIQANMVKI